MTDNAVGANPAQGSQVAPPGNQTNTDPLFEKRVLALQQKERELQKMQAGLKDHVSWDQLKDMAKKDRKSVFERLGIEDYAPAEPVDPVKAEIASLREQIENDKRTKQEREFKDNVRAQLKDNSDKYELLQLLGAEDEIFEHYGRANKEDGTPYEPLELADIIEQNLYSKLEKIKSAKKLADWFKPTDTSKSESMQMGTKTNHPLDTKNTLSSDDRGAVSGETPTRPLSRYEALSKAAQHLQFKK